MGAFQVLLIFVNVLALLPLLDSKRIQQSSEKIVAAAEGMESSNLVSSSEDQFGPTKDPVVESLVQRCVMARAKDFPGLLERLGIDRPKDAGTASIATLVDKVVGIKDMQNHRHSSRGKIGNWLHWDSFSSSAKKWKTLLTSLEQELEKSGFDYEAAKGRCAKGMNDEAYGCMVGKAPNSDPTLRDQVKTRIDIKDILEHPVANKYSEHYDGLWKRVYDLDTKLEAAKYDWTASKKECRGDMHHHAETIKADILAQLSQGDTAQSGDRISCAEASGGMCPEGTYVTTKRRRDAVKGGAVFAITYPLGKISLAPVGYSLGAAVGGPAGAAAGGVAASLVGAWLAFAVSYWASLGPDECACFLRDCNFVPEEGGCRIVTEDEPGSPTKNPFASKLPMAGHKCELQYKSEDTCMMIECGNEDYSGLINDPGFTGQGLNLYGKLGQSGSGIYNCLSDDGEPTGSLNFATHLAEGTTNTVEKRVELFKSLQDVGARFGDLPEAQAKVCRDETAIPGSNAWKKQCQYDNMHTSTDETRWKDGLCKCNRGWEYDTELERCEWCGMNKCYDNKDITSSDKWWRCNQDHMHTKNDLCRCDTGHQWVVTGPAGGSGASGKCKACEWSAP